MIIFFIKNSFILIGRFMSSFKAFASFALYVAQEAAETTETIYYNLYYFSTFDVPNHNQLPCSNSINFPCQTYFSNKLHRSLTEDRKSTSQESNQKRELRNKINTLICCHSSFQCPLSSKFSIIHFCKTVFFSKFLLDIRLFLK